MREPEHDRPRLRARFYAAYLYAVTLLFGLGGLLVRHLPGPVALHYARAWAGCLLAGLPIAGVRLRVSGLQHVPSDAAALLASQHQSEFDTLVWMRLLRRPAYVMKQELIRTPLVGPMLVPAGMIPVDRAGGAGALRGLLTAVTAARAARRQILIFPEGTRVAPGQRATLQPGIAAVASRLQLPVIPVATNSGQCWPRDRRLLRPGVIHIAVGAPLPTSLPRYQLLPAIEAFWLDAATSFTDAVDKPVDNHAENAPQLGPFHG